MPEPIGSVYLDRPRPTRARPDPRQRLRAALASQFCLIGIVGLTLAGLLAGVRLVFATPDPLVDAVQTAIADPESRADIEVELADAIREGLLSPELLAAAEAYGIDHEAEIQAWTSAVLADPAFSEAVGELVTDVHGRVFLEAKPGPVDVAPVTDVVVSVAEETAPSLAPFLPPDGRVVDIDASSLPDLTRPMSVIDQVVLFGLMAGAALPLAVLVHDRRHRVFAWVGRWLLVVGVVLGVAALGLPWFAGRVTGWVTVEAAVRTSSLRLLAPAGIAGTVGVGLVSLGAVWSRREKRKVAQEGAAAWLDVVEPPPMVASSPSLDLARRGLVDGSRHLTNF